MMQAHYGFSNEQFANLKKDGVTETDLFKCVKMFDPENSGEPLSFVNLFYYVDTKGNFNDPPMNAAHRKIAKMMFSNLKARQQIELMEYVESAENDFEDDDD